MQKTWLVYSAAAIAAFVFVSFVFLQRNVPLIAADEIGFLSVARYLALGEIITLGNQPFYPIGAPLLWSFLFKLMPHESVYYYVIVMNAAMIGAMVPLLILISREFVEGNKYFLAAAATVVALWPNYLQPAAMATAETSFRFFFILSVYLLVRATKPDSRWALPLFGATVAYLYLVHARGLLIVPIGAGMIALLWWSGRCNRRIAVSSIGLLCLVFVAGRLLSSHVAGVVWEDTGRWLGVARKISVNFTADRMDKLMWVGLGQAWYQAATTLGLVVVGFLYLALNSRKSLVALYVLTSFLVVFATSTGHLTAANRHDHLIYGRYVDGASIMLFWFGLLAFVAVGGSRIVKAGLALGISSILIGGYLLHGHGLPLSGNVVVNTAGILPFSWLGDRLRILHGMTWLTYKNAVFVVMPLFSAWVAVLLVLSRGQRSTLLFVLLTISVGYNYVNIWYANSATNYEARRIEQGNLALSNIDNDRVFWDTKTWDYHNLYKIQWSAPHLRFHSIADLAGVPSGEFVISWADSQIGEAVAEISERVWIYRVD